MMRIKGNLLYGPPELIWADYNNDKNFSGNIFKIASHYA